MKNILNHNRFIKIYVYNIYMNILRKVAEIENSKSKNIKLDIKAKCLSEINLLIDSRKAMIKSNFGLYHFKSDKQLESKRGELYKNISIFKKQIEQLYIKLENDENNIEVKKQIMYKINKIKTNKNEIKKEYDTVRNKIVRDLSELTDKFKEQLIEDYKLINHIYDDCQVNIVSDEKMLINFEDDLTMDLIYLINNYYKGTKYDVSFEDLFSGSEYRHI